MLIGFVFLLSVMFARIIAFAPRSLLQCRIRNFSQRIVFLGVTLLILNLTLTLELPATLPTTLTSNLTQTVVLSLTYTKTLKLS